MTKKAILATSILSLFLLSGCWEDDKTSKRPSGTSAQEELAKRKLKLIDNAQAKKAENSRKRNENTVNPAKGMFK